MASFDVIYNWADMRANPKNYYMGAKPYTEKNISKLPWSTGVLVQDKIDGVYIRIHKAITGTVTAFLRSGREVDINLLPGLREDLNRLPAVDLPYFIEGDVVADNEAGFLRREETAGYINQITKSGVDLFGEVEFCLFCWFKGNKGDTAIAGWQAARRLAVHHLFPNIFMIPQEEYSIRENISSIQEYAEDRVAYGKREGNAPRDGIVCKDPDQKWEAGKPAGCVKVKPWQTMYMTVTGVTKHTKNPDMIGALICMYADDELSIQVNIGSGMTNEDRLKDPNWYLGKRVLVEFEDITEPNKKGIRSLSLPRFKGVVS